MKNIHKLLLTLVLLFSFASTSYAALTDNIVAYYKLDNVNDSVASFTLTNNGSTPFNPAKINNGYDGGIANGSKYLTIANNLGISGSAMSISLWFSLSTIPGTGINYFLAHLGDDVTDVEYILAYRDNAGTKQLYFNRVKQNLSNNEIISNQTLTVGVFYHIVITYNGSTMTLYLNNVSLGTLSASGNGISAGITGFRIGADLNGPSLFTSGLIDEVGVWSRALTSPEISELYRSGSGITYPFTAVSTPSTLGFFMYYNKRK